MFVEKTDENLEPLDEQRPQQNESARNRQKKAGAREDTLCSLVFQGGEPCLKIVDLLLKEIGFSL